MLVRYQVMWVDIPRLDKDVVMKGVEAMQCGFVWFFICGIWGVNCCGCMLQWVGMT